METDDEEYIPTPLQLAEGEPLEPVNIPNHCAFIELRQIEQFVNQINKTRSCRTAGCNGRLAPCDVMTYGMGVAVKVTYMCSGCQCVLHFQPSSNTTQLVRNNLKLAIQVSFITAGCTYATYVKGLRHILGIKPVSGRTFMRTIETLHPIVEQMVNEMCEREKQRMKRIDPTVLGSWKKAVTCADGTWMTRGFHSKNATFSIRNYNTGALLYYKHVCQ